MRVVCSYFHVYGNQELALLWLEHHYSLGQWLDQVLYRQYITHFRL